MNTAEIFSPIGWLQLNEEQAQILKKEIGVEATALPLFDVVGIGRNDVFVPVTGISGLTGLVFHFESVASPPAGARLIGSIIKEMEAGPISGSLFAAHSKLLARRAEGGSASPEPQK